ncbi:MAG TPA: putative Ig domain-containing protein [Jatrophihabitans sp.]
MRARSRAVIRVVVTLVAAMLLAPLLTGVIGPEAANGLVVGPLPGQDTKCWPDPARVTCFALIQPVPIRPSTVRSTGPYAPLDLRSAYRVPSTSTTATVAVIEAYGAPHLETDLATYRSHYGLPQCTVANGCLQVVDQNGGPALKSIPADRDGWEDETVLDIEMVSAICPTCHVLLVQATSDYLNDMLLAVDQAVAQGAKYISMSWGAPEQQNGARLTAVPGVVYVAASGDAGYGTAYPAADVNVVSVGGTSLVHDTSTRGWTDTVWNNGAGGTGGGCSSEEQQPDWQRAIPGLSSACGNRSMNDVSIVADPNTGVYVYDQGSWVEGGGTSAGTPMIAAMYAIAGSPSADLPAPAIPYQHPQDFADVTKGSNGSCGQSLCKAAKGYDTPSGLGVPQGVGAFIAGPTSSTITVTKPSKLTSYVGQSTTVKLKASNSTAARMTFFASGLPSGLTLKTNGTVSGKPKGAGTHTVRLTVVDGLGSQVTTAFTWKVTKPHKLIAVRKPTIHGTIKPGSVVKATWGTLHKDSTKGRAVHPKVALQWLVNGRPVKGATKQRFRIPASSAGKKISFRITANELSYVPYKHVATMTVMRSLP